MFFLCGLYLDKFGRSSAVAFIVLVLEAGVIDYYATSVQGISNWCMTPAYWFLIPTYGSLWLVGRWSALRLAMQGNDLIGLALAAWAASSFAFIFSNTTFYIFAERYADMSALEYASRVVQYYVSVVLLYIASTVAVHMSIDMLGKQRAHS